MEVKYHLDGIDFKDYSVYVSSSDGLLSKPKLKKLPTQDWETYHGSSVFLEKKYYDIRTIKLQCFIVAADALDLINKSNVFLKLFDKPFSSRLSVSVDSSEPLVYEVYCEEAIDIEKTWKDGQMIGSFQLSLKEPEPLKKVIKKARTGDSDKTLSITFTSAKMINVYWGDGTHSFDVYGTNRTITHNYTTNGIFYAVITGNIDEIASLTTNGNIVWSKL